MERGARVLESGERHAGGGGTPAGMMAGAPAQAVEPGQGRHRLALVPGWSLWRMAALRSAGMPFTWLASFATPPGEAREDPGGEDGTAGDAPARSRSTSAVRSLLSRPAFLEALTWQNPPLMHNWVQRYAASLRDGEAPPLTRRDQREALIAFLAQRYCAKNETIGFFGPVAWARFDDRTPGLVVEGDGGLRRRSLHLEIWAAKAVADAWAEDPRLLPYLLARLHPTAGFDGQVLYRSRRRPEPVSGITAAVLGALATPSQVRAVIERVEAASSGPFGRRDALAEVLRLRDAGAVVVGFPVPIDGAPERHLRRMIMAIDDDALRRTVLGDLDTLEAARDAVAAAAGDPTALLEALDALEAGFVTTTGRSGRRDKAAGKLGRAVVYEDCRRDLDVTVGGELVEALRRPLGILLDSARWFVSEVADEVEAELAERLAQLRRRQPGAPVCLSDLVLLAGDILTGQPGTAVHRVVEDFRARWAELLATGSGSPRRLLSSQVAPLADALFPAGRIGWRAARHHSPDLLLRAGREGRDRPQWILGELHLALNTLENRVFEAHADDPAELLAAAAADAPGGRVIPLYPIDGPEVTSRTYPPPALDVVAGNVYWSFAGDEGHPAGVASLPGAGLRVADAGGRLVVRPVAGGWEADLLEFLGEFLTALVVNRFQLRDPAAHAPRVLLDDLVICRESWRIAVAEVPLPPPKRADYRHRELRSWLLDRGVPRHVFARAPGEPKPHYVDLDAPLSLRNLTRVLRRALDAGDPAGLAVDLVEMLPGPDDLWLTDRRGDRFTSEFRVVALDERDWDLTPVVRSLDGSRRAAIGGSGAGR